jgi:hypothetical protein
MSRAVGLILFLLGAVVTAAVVVMGKLYMPELQGPDALPLARLHGTPAMLKLSVFGYGFPLGLGLCVVGAATLGRAGARRAGLLAAAALAGVGIVIAVPHLFGDQRSPLYFGVGGVAILALFLLTAWSWGVHRRSLTPGLRAAADLQALGYLCFAIAAWNACGAGGMPGFALDPERVLALGTGAMATARFKVVMAFFVLGWLLTLLGFRRAIRCQGSD